MVAYALNHQGLEDIFQSSVNHGAVLFQSLSLKVYAATLNGPRACLEVNTLLNAVALLRRLIDLKGNALKDLQNRDIVLLWIGIREESYLFNQQRFFMGLSAP
jgi:hypothetical protein